MVELRSNYGRTTGEFRPNYGRTMVELFRHIIQFAGELRDSCAVLIHSKTQVERGQVSTRIVLR